MTEQRLFAQPLLDPDAAAPSGLRSWNGSDPVQRFGVYRNNVAVSLVDALADNFPVVQALVGEEFFRAMARRFVCKHPPANPVLALYGFEFPGFIANFPPTADLPYLADVARLEWLYQNASHGPDAPALNAEQLAPVLADPECLSDLRLQRHPTATPFHSQHAAVSLWAAHQQEEPAELDAQLAAIDLGQAESAFVVREGLAVSVILLSTSAVEFLTQLGDGVSLGSAAQFAQDTDPDFDLAQTLGLALRVGLFTGDVNENP